jgi:hypothetical protein
MHAAEPPNGTNKSRKPRADGQITGLAGELCVAAELLKRGLQTSLTFGHAKAIDLFAVNPRTRRSFTIQVKAVRRKNPWPISHHNVYEQHTYVFVVLNEPGKPVEYFIVPGAKLSNEPDLFTKWFVNPKFPSVDQDTLRTLGFADAWQHFDEP